MPRVMHGALAGVCFVVGGPMPRPALVRPHKRNFPAAFVAVTDTGVLFMMPARPPRFLIALTGAQRWPAGRLGAVAKRAQMHHAASVMVKQHLALLFFSTLS